MFQKIKKPETPEQELADYNIYRFRNTLLGKKGRMIIAYKEKSTGDAKVFKNQSVKKNF